MENALRMLSILVYDGLRPRNMKEIEISVKKAVMGNELSSFQSYLTL